MNLCRENVAETTQLNRMLMDEVFSKLLKENPENFLDMGRAALEGIKTFHFFLDTDSFLKFMYHLNNVECKKLYLS